MRVSMHLPCISHVPSCMSSDISSHTSCIQLLIHLFAHFFARLVYIADQMLEPLPPFATAEMRAKFPPILAGHQVTEELRAISLDKTSHA